MLGNSDHAAAAAVDYDVVIVGSGVSGAITARVLADGGLRVLVLEAGPGDELSLSDYQEHLARFYATAGKENNAPYAINPNAPMPRSPEVRRLQAGQPDSEGYL